MRHPWLITILTCAGCNALLGIDDLTLEGSAPADAPNPPGEDCYGHLIGACFVPPPTGNSVLSGALDTSSDPRCKRITPPMGVEVCAIHAESFTISGNGLTVTGSRPLMLVASDSITVAGPLDAGSVGGMTRGPGSNPAAAGLCLAPAAGRDSTSRGGGGGAGATLGSIGARGGDGGNSPGSGANPTGTATVINGLRGGCPGSNGGQGQDCPAISIGRGGDGGGAIYLYAGTTMTISARVQASGSGGGKALGNKCGGGGAGSGGMVALEAATITLDGAGEVFANGGGGGEGGASVAVTSGAESTGWDQPAAGGAIAADGGDGGDGAAAGTAATPGGAGSTPNESGGGGGGGGVGLIRIRGTLAGANVGRISPAATTF